ncbi:MAG: IS110 family transposase [bacterium]
MFVVGVDAHKTVHVAVALDDQGRELAQWSGPNSASGWSDLSRWADSLSGSKVWGIEGAWSYGRGLAQRLVADGETVYEINARWTALNRRNARRPGKTDRLDAHAVARFVRQEAPHLPLVGAEDETAVLDLLTTEREAVLAEATRLRNQIHALLLQIDPEYKVRYPNLRTRSAIENLSKLKPRTNDELQTQRIASVHRLAKRLRLAMSQAGELAADIEERAAEYAPLTKLCGVNLLTAGTLAGILGPGRRFASDAQLAAYAGAAPLEASSAGLVRHRLNRGGNRRLNTVLYRIALTQAHHLPSARTYIDRRVGEGKTRREARRALTRYIVRAVWRLWQECAPAAAGVRFGEAA